MKPLFHRDLPVMLMYVQSGLYNCRPILTLLFRPNFRKSVLVLLGTILRVRDGSLNAKDYYKFDLKVPEGN